MSLLDRILKRKIIIGIHGLANKPPEKLLKIWWKESIREGFDTIGKPKRPFRFTLVYWADFIHQRPQDPKEKNKKNHLFLDGPYLPGNSSVYAAFTPSNVKKRILEKLEENLDRKFFEEKSIINYDSFSNLVIRKLFKDLDFYYNKSCPVPRYADLNAMQAIRERLASVLRKHRGKEILLIAHSMGTIVSYDVLTQAVPDVKIHTFITIGSPLALPVIKKKICGEQGRDCDEHTKLPAPENIEKAWYNFSDLNDPIAINYNLADDYRMNSRGIEPIDIVIYNNYEYEGKRDAHKSYGYTRAPEVARVMRDFLG